MIENSDPDAFGASELDMAVTEFLRKRQLSRGQHLKVAKDLDVSAEEERLQQQLQAHEEDYSDMVIPEFEDVVDKYNRGEKLTFEDRVTAEAWTSLQNRAKAKPKTLSSLWSDYAASNGFNKSVGPHRARAYRHGLYNVISSSNANAQIKNQPV